MASDINNRVESAITLITKLKGSIKRAKEDIVKLIEVNQALTREVRVQTELINILQETIKLKGWEPPVTEASVGKDFN